MKRQQRFPLPHNRLGLKHLRWVTQPLVWYQNRDVPSVGRAVDRTIPWPAGRLDVRLYCPKGAGPFPTVVFLHGGGYVLGSIATHDRLCRQLVRASGCAFLSVDYRLAPEHPFPATVVTPGFDPLRDGGRAYAEQLASDGVPTCHRNYGDMPHGFLTLRGVDRVQEAIAEVGGDLAEAFE